MILNKNVITCSGTVLLFPHKVENLDHAAPPYSPDLVPCDFWLFPTLKVHLRGLRFNMDDEVLN